MGGRGSGGRRMGAGRKRKGTLLAFRDGSRQRSGQAPEAPADPAIVECPTDAPEKERAVWAVRAPDAIKAGTLTALTARSFLDEVCRPHVMYGHVLGLLDEQGWTYLKETKFGSEPRKHPLLGDLLQWQRRIEAGHARFCLAPFGKPVGSTSSKPEDPFGEFEASHG